VIAITILLVVPLMVPLQVTPRFASSLPKAGWKSPIIDLMSTYVDETPA
jgi:hypothetical protein